MSKIRRIQLEIEDYFMIVHHQFQIGFDQFVCDLHINGCISIEFHAKHTGLHTKQAFRCIIIHQIHKTHSYHTYNTLKHIATHIIRAI